MKIHLDLPNGATLDFEGDAAEFERISSFLAEPPESLIADRSAPPAADHRHIPVEASHAGQEEVVALDAASVAARIDKVGARNDQERVTVMAQIANEVGRDGIDFPTIIDLYTELGLPKPAQFPSKTLSNAKSSGLMRPLKPGVWRPTHRGENFARGFGRGPERPIRRSARPKTSTESGGEFD